MKSDLRLIAGAALTIVLVGLFAAPRSSAALLYTGVNLAGAESGFSSSRPLPGDYGTDYAYPTTAEVSYFLDKGMNTFRLPFRWERLQRQQFSVFDSSELGRIDAIVNHATGRGAYVVLDPHNFARYFPIANNYQSSALGTIGSAGVPNTAFADLWSRLANRYKNNSRVIFQLTNAPNSMSSEQWVAAANEAIAAIRATGAGNLILIPGNGWSRASTWLESSYGTSNATAMLNVVDPANNYAYAVNQFLDGSGAGYSAEIGSGVSLNDVYLGANRLDAFTQWLRDHNQRAFLAEFAVSNSRIGSGSNSDGPQIGDEALTNMLSYIRANSDVWMGWTWWAAGPRLGNYLFSIEPTNLGLADESDRPAMGVLGPFFARTIPGDFNNDDRVDAADYTIWRDGLGGTHYLTDYPTWKANFGIAASGAGVSSTVPEASTTVLLIIAWIALGWRRICGRLR